jgi:hypothetical protein
MVEETGIDDAIPCADIPEFKRIRAVDISFSNNDTSNGEVTGPICTLLYSKNPYVDPSTIREHAFRWDDIEDQGVQESVRQLLGRVLNFEFLSLST